MVSCQNCGSKTSNDGQHCAHCGGKLSKLLCRKCFYPLPGSAAYCILCGTEQVHHYNEPISTELECPHCAVDYGIKHHDRVVLLEDKPAVFGDQEGTVDSHYYECPRCYGNWMSESVLLLMLEQSAQRKGVVEPEKRERGIEDRSYFRCPNRDCAEMLSRFLWTRVVKQPLSNMSFPVIDKCSGCSGIWLDNGELDWLLEMGPRALPSMKSGPITAKSNCGGVRAENGIRDSLGDEGDGAESETFLGGFIEVGIGVELGDAGGGD